MQKHLTFFCCESMLKRFCYNNDYSIIFCLILIYWCCLINICRERFKCWNFVATSALLEYEMFEWLIFAMISTQVRKAILKLFQRFSEKWLIRCSFERSRSWQIWNLRRCSSSIDINEEFWSWMLESDFC